MRLLQSELPLFDADQCSFEVEKSRETTARIVGWRHLGISNIYTLECSLAGSNQHPPQVTALPCDNIDRFIRFSLFFISSVQRIGTSPSPEKTDFGLFLWKEQN